MAGYGAYRYDGSGSGFNEEDPMWMQMNQGLSQDTSSVPISSGGGGINGGQLATAGATGAAMGGPVGAGIAVGGSLLTQSLANSAQNARDKRNRAVQIEDEYTKNMSNNLSNLLAAYRGALR